MTTTLHAWWVEPGRLLAGEYPGATHAREGSEEVAPARRRGSRLNRRPDDPHDHLDSYREALQLAAQRAGREVRHFAHPIPDNSVIHQDGYDRIIVRIRAEIAAGRIVYVHCWGGKGRTSTVVGCLLIDDGLDYDATIARIAELRAGTRKAFDACPESSSQHRVLRERAARRRRTLSRSAGDVTTCARTSCRSRCRQSCSIHASRSTAEHFGMRLHLSAFRTSHVGSAPPHSAGISDAVRNGSRASCCIRRLACV